MNKRSPSHSNQNQSLRTLFKQGLGKLQLISTRDQAFKDIKTLILQNKTTSNLRVFLSVLSQNRNKHQQSQLNIIGFIIEKYSTHLLDPLDKQPSVQKTIFRVTQLIMKHFNSAQINVQLACQKAWVQIYLSVIFSQDIQLKKKLLFSSLQVIISGGGGKVAQTTAQFVIQGLLQSSLNKQDLEFFKQIAKRTLVLFLKTTVIHFSTLMCVQTILSFFGVNSLIPLLETIIAKVVHYIKLATSNSLGYKIKSQACNTLGLIGQQIDKNGLQVYSKVIKILQDLATDKVWAVQSAGRKALTVWKNKAKQWDQEYLQKQEKYAQQYDYEDIQQNNLRRKDPQTTQDFYKKTYQQNAEQNKQNQYFQQDIVKRQQNQRDHPPPKTHQNNWFPNRQNNQKPPQYNTKINKSIPLVLQHQRNPSPQQFSHPKNNKKHPSPEKYNQKQSPQQHPQHRIYKTYNQGFNNQSKYLQKNTGVGGGNNVQSVENFYQHKNGSKQTYTKKMQQIKKSIYNQNKTVEQGNIQYDETIPWEEAKSMPDFKAFQKQQRQTNKSNVKSTVQPYYSQKNKQIQPDNPDLMFVEQWQQIVELFEKSQKQKAVKMLLQMDDDIYFLRFLLQYGHNLLKDLTRLTSTKLLKKMLSIQKTSFMEQMLFKMVGQTAKIKAGQLLTNSQNMSIVKNLEGCQKIAQLQRVSLKVKDMYQKSLNA